MDDGKLSYCQPYHPYTGVVTRARDTEKRRVQYYCYLHNNTYVRTRVVLYDTRCCVRRLFCRSVRASFETPFIAGYCAPHAKAPGNMLADVSVGFVRGSDFERGNGNRSSPMRNCSQYGGAPEPLAGRVAQSAAADFHRPRVYGTYVVQVIIFFRRRRRKSSENNRRNVLVCV